MNNKILRILGLFLLVAMTILAVVHAKFYGGYQELGSGSTILYVITTILGVGGFTLRIIAWIKNPSSKQKSYY